MKNPLKRLLPPCPKCPYKLGLIHTVANPCPQCKLEGYSTYERFRKMMDRSEPPR